MEAMWEIDNQVREHVIDHLLGQATLEKFEEWFVGATWDAESELVGAIELLFAEKSNLSDEEICKQLMDAVKTIQVGTTSSFQTGTANATVEYPSLVLVDGNPTITKNLEFSDS
jgi:hypothetical protein